MHINISGLRFWDGHHCYGLTQATVAVISKPTVFPPSTICSPLSPSGEWIDCKVICWLRGRLLTLSLFSSSDFMASECVLRLKLLHCAFLAIRDLVTSLYFILQGFIPRDTKSSICLHVFGSVVSWVLGYLSLLFCIPPDRVGCVAVTNGPTIYLSGLLYKEIFFSCILSLNPHEPQLNSPARYSRGGKTNMVNHILSSRAPTQMWHIYSQ